jgi:phage terminase Nu1 subunit (DNA packaging protein)
MDDSWLDGVGDNAEQISADFAGPGELVDKVQLGNILGLTRYAIEEHIKRGAPVHRRGSKKLPWQIDVGAFLQWMIQDKLSPAHLSPGRAAFEDAKTRKAIADAIGSEMRAARIVESTISKVEFQQLLAEERTIIHDAFVKVPARVRAGAKKLGPQKTAQQVHTLVADEIDAAMSEIQSAAGVDYDQASDEVTA